MMTIIRVLLFFPFLITSVPALSDICSPDKNVKDYFLSIPHSSLMLFDDEIGALESVNDRENAIKTFDPTNGFIELDSFSILSLTQIVLFRGNEKTPIIMVTSDGVSVQNKYVFICRNQKWVEVTSKVFTKIPYKRIAELYNSKNVLPGIIFTAETLMPVAHTLIRYKLPRFGKNIKAYASHPDISVPENNVLLEFVPQLGNL